MTPEDRASKAMAECVAKGRGENVAFYLVGAIEDAVLAERKRCADVVRSKKIQMPINPIGDEFNSKLEGIAVEIQKGEHAQD